MKRMEKVGVGAIIAAILIAIGFGAVALMPEDGDSDFLSGNPRVQPTAKRFCTIAGETNGSTLLSVAQTTDDLDGLIVVAQGYARSAPPGIDQEVNQVVSAIANMKDGSRTVSRSTNQAAAKVDAWVAVNCD